MTDVVSVINLTAVPRENEHEPSNAQAMEILATNQHIVIHIDKQTPSGRWMDALDFFGSRALSTKVVNEDFTKQYCLTIKEWSL